MPSNQLPEDVKRAASILLRNHMLGMELPDDECDDCIDLIAPLIIEWALGEAVDWARSCSGESADAAGALWVLDRLSRLLPSTPTEEGKSHE
jgi:hypothetical protein